MVGNIRVDYMTTTSLKGWILAIAGGFGLGMVIGSEFHGSWMNYIGIIILLISIIMIAFENIRMKQGKH